MTVPLTNLAPAIIFSDERKVVASSPFPITWQEMRARFGGGPHRARLANGFEAWVRAAHGLVDVEFVWIGGSFASDKPEPADVDAVMFYQYREPLAHPALREAFLARHASVLTRDAAKAQWNVDAALIALSAPVAQLIHLSAYWAMVFSNGPDATRRAFFSVEGASIIT
jgi:hypothetical protein